MLDIFMLARLLGGSSQIVMGDCDQGLLSSSTLSRSFSLDSAISKSPRLLSRGKKNCSLRVRLPQPDKRIDRQSALLTLSRDTLTVYRLPGTCRSNTPNFYLAVVTALSYWAGD